MSAVSLGLSGGFIGKLSSSKLLMQVLKSINFKDESTFSIGNNGLKVTLEESKCFQANAFVPREIFSEFTFEEADMNFNVSLLPVIECINLIGMGPTGPSVSSVSATALGGSGGAAVILHYSGYGQPLRLWLEEEGVVSEASIKTKDSSENVDFNFCKSKVSAKVIIVSEHIREIFSELDGSSESVEFKFCPHASSLKISTFGNLAHYSVEIPSTSDMINHFQVDDLKSARYRLHLLKAALKPITMSEKVSIRIDHRDFLCLQYMVKFNEGTCFVEFYCAPDED